jgi:chromosome partitioning protein
MKTLLIATRKGDAGRSALLCQLAHYLHFIVQWRALVIDLDDQTNSSRSLERTHKASALGITAPSLFMDDAPDVSGDLPAFSVVNADDEIQSSAALHRHPAQLGRPDAVAATRRSRVSDAKR